LLVLVKLSNEYRTHLNEMMDEWFLAKEKIVPYSIRRIDYKDFEKYLQGFEEEEHGVPGFVPATTFFGLDTERNIFIGAVNIRHHLNESLLLNGGHIGDGVRPSERRKGYATKMIALALDECRKLGIDRVLMVCDKSNIGSAKSIINNGGVLENEIEIDGNVEQRYWISLI
jgi:predicted acetyltransferase